MRERNHAVNYSSSGTTRFAPRAAFQANDLRRAIVSGIGEYSPDGELRRIREIESSGVTWLDDWESAVRRHMKLRASV